MNHPPGRKWFCHSPTEVSPATPFTTPGCASGTASENPPPWRGPHRSGSVFRDSMHLTALDFLVLAGYFIGLIAMGMYFSRRQTSQASYFLADRKMPWFLV